MELIVAQVFRMLSPLTVVLFATATLFGDTTIKRDLSPAEIEDYTQDLSRTQQIITDLDVRLVKGLTVFDVTTASNSEARPWVILVNISDSEFRKNSKKYADDGFAMPIHRVITVKRKRFHSAVWVQDPDAGIALTLPTDPLPETGELGSELMPLRELMRKVIQEHNIPGGTLAVSKDGVLIFEYGFGYSDIDTITAMPASANMRIASLSKPITAVAILILVQEGRLDPDRPLLELLASHPVCHFDTEKTTETDARWSQVTVRHLLHHTGGWDRDKSRDTVFQLAAITSDLQLGHLARIPDIITYQLGRPLDFEPGSKFAYSNVGYCMLGRVIESVSGQTYEQFVTDRILKPAGMTQTRLGKTRLSDRAKDEVHYYTQLIQKHPALWDLVSGSRDPEMVTAPYGAWDLEIMDAHGGWTSTASDLLRFTIAIDSPASPLLTPESRRMMLEQPSFKGASNTGVWYGLGWNVRNGDASGGKTFWHTGALAGTSTLLVRRFDGFSWAVLFNVDKTKNGARCARIIDGQMHYAVSLLPAVAPDSK